MMLLRLTPLFSFIICASYAQIPIEKYTREIQQLKHENEIEKYWEILHDIDQNILVQTLDPNQYDSISTDLLVRSVLLFQYHDTIGYNRNKNVIPVLNLAHSNIPQHNVIYWPIIEKCAALGGAIQTNGGTYPAYELEVVSLEFYNYSLAYETEKYQELLSKLHGRNNEFMIQDLIKAWNSIKKCQSLKTIRIIGSWYDQPFKSVQEETSFQLVERSDHQLYIKRSKKNYLHLLELPASEDQRFFRLEFEPFGWIYSLDKEGNIVLLDDKMNMLIAYKKV